MKELVNLASISLLLSVSMSDVSAAESLGSPVGIAHTKGFGDQLTRPPGPDDDESHALRIIQKDYEILTGLTPHAPNFS